MNEKKGKLKFEQPSLLAAFKVVLIEWFLSSTAHALPNIFRTGNILLKVIWTVCLLASGSYCIYSMVVSLLQYLEYPTYFTTEIIQEIPAPFPAVTICNIKTVNKTSSMNYFNQPSFQPFKINASVTPSTLQYIIPQQYLIRTVVTNDKTLTTTQKEEVGFQMKDMLMSCLFNYGPCSYNDFAYYYDPLFGNCYTFNGGSMYNGTKVNTKKISVGGPMYGLIMEFFLGNPDVDTTYDYNDGLIISIHNQSSLPFMDNKMMAAAGADTDLIVSRSFISKLEAPYGNCLNDTTSSSSFSSYYFDYIVRTLKTSYSQKYCYTLCLQKYINDTCGCANTFLPALMNTQYCASPSGSVCIYRIIDAFGDLQANKDCQTACPFECNSMEYDVSNFRSLYPTRFYQKVLAENSLIKYNNITYADIPLSVAKVNVYYKNMVYSQTTETIAITTEGFFSNMGGTLGLYLGISMLSLVEIVELLVNMIIAVLSYSKAKSQINSMNQNIQYPLTASTIVFDTEKSPINDTK